MKKILSILLTMITMLILGSCSHVHYVTEKNGCELSLDGLWWTHRVDLDCDNNGEACLYYKAALTEGEVNVYYDQGLLWEKEFLFSIKAGETIESKGGYVEGDVDIIIEPLSPTTGTIEIFYSK